MMTVPRRTLIDVLHEGHKALAKELGPADMIRFIQSYSSGRGDYVKERYAILGDDDVKTLAARIRAKQEQPRNTGNGD